MLLDGCFVLPSLITSEQEHKQLSTENAPADKTDDKEDGVGEHGEIILSAPGDQ